MEILENIINYYNLVINFIEELKVDSVKTLNEYGGFT
jgi:hypothetical protein